MQTICCVRRYFVALAALGVVLILPKVAHSQGWVSEENSLSMSAQYSLGVSDSIVESEGEELTDRPVTHHVFGLSGNYGTPIRGLEVNASLPFVLTRFDLDAGMGRPHGPWDDGESHFTPTDLRLGTAYQFLERPLGAAVSLAGSIPVADYATTGFAAPGRHLMALHLGVGVSKSFEPWAERLHAHAAYEFSLVERVDLDPELEKWGQNRSDISARIGYLITDSLNLSLATNVRIAHGGINFLDFADYPMVVQTNHDLVLRENVFLLGGGLAYFLGDKLALVAEARAFITGTNTRNASLFTFGVQYQAM